MRILLPLTAERLADIHTVLHSTTGLVLLPGPFTAHEAGLIIARVALAERYATLPAVTRFRAVAEDWSAEQVRDACY